MKRQPQTPVGSDATPDELEQRRRADGSIDESVPLVDEDGEPIPPDELEQRQLQDGTFVGSGTTDHVDDAPLSADMIEQRQIVEYDEEDDRPAE